MISIQIPDINNNISTLRAGDQVLLSGTLFTARDAAHIRLAELIAGNKPLPMDLAGAVIYYCGPCPAKPGEPIGSCGPTTASRMDPFTPVMLSQGIIAMIGKGPRSPATVAAIQQHGAVYFAATGGIAALLAGKVITSTLIAFGDLGPEAIYRLEVKNFPLLVAIDSQGNNIYDTKR